MTSDSSSDNANPSGNPAQPAEQNTTDPSEQPTQSQNSQSDQQQTQAQQNQQQAQGPKQKKVDLTEIMKDAPFPHRPEHDIYFIALQQVWEDNIITDDEKRMLDGLQTSLGITQDEHKFLESKIIKDDSEQHLNTYRKILEQAWADGILTLDEQALLTKMRTKLDISEAEHAKLEMEIKSKLPEAVEQQIVVDESDPSYWVRKGEEIWSSSEGHDEDANKAISCFDKAIELEPLNYFAWANKGLILKKLDRREEAILCYDRAIQIQPNYPNSWFNKGVLLGCLGQLEEAVKCFDKVLEIAPNHKLALRDKQMLIDIINRKQSSRVKTRTLKLKGQ